MWKAYARQYLPDKYISRVRGALAKRNRDRRKAVTFTEDDLLFALTEICGVKSGDVVFVHSSIDGLAMEVSPKRILDILLSVVGPEGTILMPSYPKLPSHMLLKSGRVWNVRRTPSYSGLLTELFRRMKETRRSIHPTKSVAARGPLRDEMISEHHTSIRPYSDKSPYYKFVARNGKAIGLGVSARYIAFIHTIDDHLGPDFPATVYRDEVFTGRVIDYSGAEIDVLTLAHDLHVAYHPIPFLRKHLPTEKANSLTYKNRDFFYADARSVFDTGVQLARNGITMYRVRSRDRMGRWLSVRRHPGTHLRDQEQSLSK